jgi:hypothetical protein
MKALVLTLAVLALITAGYIKASPSPAVKNPGYLYICADPQGVLRYLDERPSDCNPGDVPLRVVGSEVYGETP